MGQLIRKADAYMGETNVAGRHKTIFCFKVSAIDTTLIILTSMCYQIILASLTQIFFLVNDAALTP